MLAILVCLLLKEYVLSRLSECHPQIRNLSAKLASRVQKDFKSLGISRELSL